MKQGQYNRGGNYYSGQGGGGGPMTDINQAQGVHLGPGNHQHLHQQGGPAMGTANVQQQMPTMTHQQSAPFQQMTVGPHVNHQQHQHTGHGSHMGHPSGQRIGYATNPNRVPNPRHTSLMSQPRQPVQSSAGLPAQPMLQGFIPQYPQPHMVNAPVISYARQPHYYAAHSNHAVPYNQPYMIHPNHGQYVLYPGYPVSGSVPQQVQNVAVRTTGNVPPSSGMGQPASLAVSNESGPPVSEPQMQHFPQPQSRPAPAAPLQKRERKGAVIQDPDTLKVVTESELLDQTTIKEPRSTEHATSISNAAPAEPTTGASIQKDTPSNRVLSSEALEFRNKIASVALTASGETGVPADALNVGENSGNTTTKTLEHVEDVNGTSVNDDKSVPSVTSSMQTNISSPHEINTSTPSETLNNVQEAAVVEASKTATISKPNQVVTTTASTSSTVNMTSNRVPTEKGSESDQTDQSSEVETLKSNRTSIDRDLIVKTDENDSCNINPISSNSSANNDNSSVPILVSPTTTSTTITNNGSIKSSSSQQNGDISHGLAVVAPASEPLQESPKDGQKETEEESTKVKPINHRPESKEDENHAVDSSSVSMEKTESKVPVKTEVEVSSSKADEDKVEEPASPCQQQPDTAVTTSSLPSVEIQSSSPDVMPNKSSLVTASKQEDANNEVCSDPTSTSSKNEASSPLQNTDSDNKKVITNNVSPPVESPKDEKFIYQSDFLKSLKNNPACLKKPEHLPKLDIIHDEPISNRPEAPHHQNRHHQSGGGGGGVGDMFLPQYMNLSLPRNQSQNSSQRRQPQRGQSQTLSRKIISTSLNQEVKLHTTDNAWKPQLVSKEQVEADEDAATKELVKLFRGILNKLTPQKYAKLLEDVKKLTIDTDKKLQMILELIFDKAVDEPAFCLQYANLCKHLATLKVMNVEENKEVKFYPLLLTRCQKEFESKMYEGIDVEGKQKKIDEATDPEAKKLLFDELDDEKRRARKRSLGNIKLIGELYKLDMLKNNIILGCIEKLLSDDEEESLECLCTLLRTIGAKLELSPKYQEQVLKSGRDPLAPYFAKLLAIVNEKKTSARVRFMIQDILDMRANQWKARKIQDENKPKTIDQIHAEAQKEEEQRMVELQQHQHQQKRQQDGGGGGGQKKEWSRRSQQGTGSAQAVNSFKNLKNTFSDQMQFGPGQTFNTFATGARGGSQKATPQQQPEQFAGTNRFAALGNDNERKRSVGGRDSQKGQSRNQNPMGMSQDVRTSHPSQERDSFMVRGNQMRPPTTVPPFGENRQRGSRNSSMEKSSAPNSRASSIRREAARKDSDAKPISLTSDKALGLLRDYLSDRDLKLAADDMKPYCSSPQNITTFVETALNHALEDTSQVRSAVGQLFSYFIINNVVSLEQFHNGLHSILSIAEDIVVDVPKFWEYMAEVLAPSFINLSDSNRRQFFVSALKPSIESGDAGKLMSHLVKYVASTNSPAKASMLWNCGKLRWSDFLKSDVNESDFVQKNNLDFLNHPSNESSTGLSDSENRDVKHLEDQKFFVEVTRKIKNGVNPLEIEDLIQQNYRSSTVNPAFASALVKAVVKACVIDPKERGNSSYALDDKKLKSFCPILVKYCENDENCEVDALFALQGLAEELEHPPKLLNQIFTTIHEQNVISMDAFLQWERNDSLVPGKAMAVMNVKQFLTWLKETEDSDS